MSIGPVLGMVAIYSVLISNIYVDAVISTLSDLDTEFANFVDSYYDKQNILPVQTVGSIIAVTLDFELVSIIEFDDDSSYVTLAGYLTVVWMEERYTTVADNIDVSVSASSIWTPPLTVINSLSSASTIGSDDDVAKFNLNTARVVWKPWVHKKVACNSNSFFPFDKQECSLKISSLTSDNTEMTLSAADDTIGMTSFQENDLWKLKSTSVRSYTVDTSPYVVYKITIQRRSQFLTFIVTCPVFIISIMHFLVFLLPEQNNQRSNYCVMSMIGVLITLLWAMTYIPTGSTPFSIVVYYLFTECLLNVAVVVVALVLSNTFRGYKCCKNGTCFDNIVPVRKPEKVSNHDDSGMGSVSNETENTPTTPNAVRLASVTTAWDDDVFDGNSNTQAGITERKPDAKAKSCGRSNFFTFVFFLTLHLCFTIAFFVPLGLNVE